MSMYDDDAPLVWKGSSAADALYADSEGLVTRCSRRVVVAVLVVLALTTFALAIATFVLAVELADSSSPNPPPCPGPGNVDDGSVNDFPLYAPAPWDVIANHPRNLSFTTTEGTWINVDVSPDGTEILFDLLGDIYVVPISGGTAQLLRGGPAFEVQARYDSTGRRIIFTSDLSGCDNIWVMDRNNPTNAVQITRESYHMVTNAMWAPSEASIIAEKWYTVSDRSIPGAELWQYPVAGAQEGGGSRFVGRKNPAAQVGAQEPIYSPNGEFVYYSQNMADNTYWSYNKNPHSGIFGIFRFNIDANSSEYVTGGPGGAARPTLSKDGKILAFIRRIYGNTTLVLRDLATGNEQLLYGLLEFDQQESSSPSGVYPSFTFVNNDTEILVWAKGGKIVRVNTQTGSAVDVAITVNVNLQLAEPVRTSKYNISNNSTSFDVKVTNYFSLATVNGIYYAAYTAIGKTFIKELPNGEPRPLLSTPLNASLEAYPSFSSRGNKLVHVLWDDLQLSTIQIITLDLTSGNISKIENISLPLGRYGYPKFSPIDDNVIVFQRFSGDTLSGNMYSLNPGIYLATYGTNAWKTQLLSSNGQDPVFSADGSAVYVNSGYYPAASLVKIEISSLNQMTVATSKYATSIQISPDEANIAFIEFKQAFIAPFNVTAPMVVTSRPGLEPSQLQRCSQDGAHYITWVRNAGQWQLAWLLANQLYLLDAAKAFECASMDLNCVVSKAIKADLGFSAATGTANITVCLSNTTLITMITPNQTTGSVIENARLVVQADRIQALGPLVDVACPTGAIDMDMSGYVVLPGYIDAHSHWAGSGSITTKQSWEFLVNLAFGVTTLHNPSADTVFVFTGAELIRNGKLIGPRIFSTGDVIYGAGGPGHEEINSLNDALSALRQRQAFGAFSVKSYMHPCRSSRQRLLAAARQLDMDVVVEGGMAFYWNLNEIMDGHTTIEHSLPMAPLYNDIITLFAQSGTGWTPTLIVNFGGLWGEEYWYQASPVWENQRLMQFVPNGPVRARSLRREMAPSPWDYHHFATAQSVAAVANAGGSVHAGAHGQLQGLGFHWEMGMLRQGGLTPYQVLYASTLGPAKILGLGKDLGSLEVGKLADLIFYNTEDSPLEEILGRTELVQLVMKDGHLWNATTMDQILPFPQSLPPGPVLNTPVL